MSDSEEPEYEVQSIVAAKVEAASRGKKSKLVWKYRVRWKGYSANEDTWEPVESFVGSDEMVQSFWERVNTDGRDIQNMSLFNIGEEFCRIGPPQRKAKRKSTTTETTEAPTTTQPETGSSKPKSISRSSEKRRHESPEIIEISDRPLKRAKQTKASNPQASSSKQQSTGLLTRSKAAPLSVSASAPPKSSSKVKTPRKLPSPEVIPDSDEETNGPRILRMEQYTPEKLRQEFRANKLRAQPQNEPSLIETQTEDVIPAETVDSDIERLFEEEPIPAHRARLANPRVKMADDPKLANIQGAISAKTRAVERIPAESASNKPDLSSKPKKRSKPGPGRSSAGHMTLLTADKKGGLKSVKPRPSARSPSPQNVSADVDQHLDAADMDVDNVADRVPPSGEVLLQLAGFDAEAADALPDFEDPIAEERGAAPNSDADLPDDKLSSRKESLDAAKDSLFPVQSPLPSGALSTTWSRPTIFGPLGLGFDSSTVAPTDRQTSTSPLFLNLDTSIAIPTFATDIPTSTVKSFTQQMDNKAAPGKFYHTDAALSLLGTVRATGEYAVVAISEDATDDDKQNFAAFGDRLKAGDIFVASAGMHILVFCSSSNTQLSARVNAPPALLNELDKILVSQVDVENYSGYADAAADADSRRWSQYIATKN